MYTLMATKVKTLIEKLQLLIQNSLIKNSVIPQLIRFDLQYFGQRSGENLYSSDKVKCTKYCKLQVFKLQVLFEKFLKIVQEKKII